MKTFTMTSRNGTVHEQVFGETKKEECLRVISRYLSGKGYVGDVAVTVEDVGDEGGLECSWINSVGQRCAKIVRPSVEWLSLCIKDSGLNMYKETVIVNAVPGVAVVVNLIDED